MIVENPEFLTSQIITYLGNKRLLIKNIEHEIDLIKDQLQKNKITCLDLFSGSGIVARMMKKHSKRLIANDLENYSRIINSCYLSNEEEYPRKLCDEYRAVIIEECKKKKIEGIISKNYAPKDDENIKMGERVFYTRENALLIDTYRLLIDKIVIDEDLKKYFLAPLITEASIHVNTSGVFKGFYKNTNTGIGCFGGTGQNALTRIFGKIELSEPVFSNHKSKVEIFNDDSVNLSKKLKHIDVAYLDPPYNQHPYGSNYFMLNLFHKFYSLTT